MNDLAATVSHNSRVYDVDAIRRDFPILSREVYGKPLVFLDSGASAQKPRAVIDAVSGAYENQYSNVHRGAHYLSATTTDAFEQSREKVAKLLNAPDVDEIVFTSSVTAAINLVAYSWARANLQAGDEILITEMEHHANIVPWLMLKDQLGIVLKVAAIDDNGAFNMDNFRAQLSDRTRLVAVTHCSNVLGSWVPVKDVTEAAKEVGATVLIDGAQGIVHGAVDVQDIGADFYAFTGHKLYGPSGIGILWGRKELLDVMPPFMGGGDMIDTVSFEKVTFKAAPHRFEAGTPPIVQAIGLGAAIDYVSEIGFDAIRVHEEALRDAAMARLAEIEGIQLIGTAPGKAAIMSFLLDGCHPYDVAAILDRAGVACRVGHHCAEPLMKRLGVIGTVRASFGMYNTLDEVETLAQAIEKARRMLA